MNQDVNDLKVGQIMLVVKNKDGSFTPLGISPSQAIIITMFLDSLSESEPFVMNTKVKLVIDK